eukprot:COSAG01_NODE_1499_length_10112_cov_22.543394_6_plen_84_part_00
MSPPTAPAQCEHYSLIWVESEARASQRVTFRVVIFFLADMFHHREDWYSEKTKCDLHQRAVSTNEMQSKSTKNSFYVLYKESC